MIKFALFTLFAFLAIDWAVCGVGKSQQLSFLDIALHHALITAGFIFGVKQGINPMMLFGISIGLWIMSLLIINIVIFKNYPNLMSIVGFVFILIGVVLIHFSIQK